MDSSSLIPSNNMAAVAARIQERHGQLLAEQATLELTKAELAEIQAVEAQHVSINDSIHRMLLHVTRSRTGVELELFQARDQVHDYTRSIEQLQESAEHLEQETDQIHGTWKTAVETTYSAHALEMDLYQRALEESVQECESRATRRKNEWIEMETHIQRAQDETTRFHLEVKSIEVDIETMESVEQRDDEEVATIALKIREALSKVCFYYCLSSEYSSSRGQGSHICSLSLLFMTAAKQVARIPSRGTRCIPQGQRQHGPLGKGANLALVSFFCGLASAKESKQRMESAVVSYMVVSSNDDGARRVGLFVLNLTLLMVRHLSCL
jgi:hypothetical protein